MYVSVWCVLIKCTACMPAVSAEARRGQPIHWNSEAMHVLDTDPRSSIRAKQP